MVGKTGGFEPSRLRLQGAFWLKCRTIVPIVFDRVVCRTTVNVAAWGVRCVPLKTDGLVYGRLAGENRC